MNYVVARQAMISAGLDNATYTDCISNSLVKMGQVFNSHANNLPLINQKYHPVNMTILTKETTEGSTLSIRAYMGTLLWFLMDHYNNQQVRKILVQ